MIIKQNEIFMNAYDAGKKTSMSFMKQNEDSNVNINLISINQSLDKNTFEAKLMIKQVKEQTDNN